MFVKALIFQSVIILCLALLILVLSIAFVPTVVIGIFYLFATSMIILESVTLVTNGRAYNEMREKIIISVNKAKR